MRQQAVYDIYDYMQQHGIKGYLLVPQCPEDRYWPGNRDYEAYTEPVKQLIRLYMKEYGIAPDRVYIFEERIAWVFSHQGNASGIKALLREPKAETFVTLSGLSTNVPRAGVVIHDGRKMIQK